MMQTVHIDAARLPEIVADLQTRVAALEAAQTERFALPEACQKHECDYYTYYLAYGPADLEHEGYHNATRLAHAHMAQCERTTVCPTCTDWERRVRA